MDRNLACDLQVFNTDMHLNTQVENKRNKLKGERKSSTATEKAQRVVLNNKVKVLNDIFKEFKILLFCFF